MYLTLAGTAPPAISPPLTWRAASRAQSIRLLLRSDLVGLRVTLPHRVRASWSPWYRSIRRHEIALAPRPRASGRGPPSRVRRGVAEQQPAPLLMICLLVLCLLVLVPSLQAPPPQRRVFAQAATMLPPESASQLPCVACFERRSHSEGRQRRPPLPAAPAERECRGGIRRRSHARALPGRHADEPLRARSGEVSCHHRKPRAAAPATALGILQP